LREERRKCSVKLIQIIPRQEVSAAAAKAWHSGKSLILVGSKWIQVNFVCQSTGRSSVLDEANLGGVFSECLSA